MADIVEINKRGGAPEGNGNGTRHSVYAKKDRSALAVRADMVKRLVNQAYDLCGWLTESDKSTVRSWAEVSALKAEAFTALKKQGIYVEDEDGDLRGKRLLTDFRLLSQLELQYAGSLGLSPASRASLGVANATIKDLASRAAALRERGEDADNG